jgi:hypothetical protein
VLIDQSANRLLIRGPEQSSGLVEQLVQTLDRPAPAGPTTTAQPPAVPAAPAPSPAAATAPTHTLRHVTWQELEDQLARYWGGRLLRSVSRDGEIATIHAQAPEGPSPVIKIDRRGDTVSFLGSAANSQGWAQVVRMLDQPQINDAQQTRLVPVEHADPRQIRQTVAMMQQAAQEDGQTEGRAGDDGLPAPRRTGGSGGARGSGSRSLPAPRTGRSRGTAPAAGATARPTISKSAASWDRCRSSTSRDWTSSCCAEIGATWNGCNGSSRISNA